MCTRGRYSAVLVQKERHLLEVLRYIVLNPVRAQIVSDAKDWHWSSYRAAIGLAPSPQWLLTDGLAAIFGSGGEGRREFVRFVEDGIDMPSCWRNLKGQIYLGDSTFVSEAQAHIPIDAAGLGEVPEVQWRDCHAPSERWEEHYAVYRNRADRDRAIVDAFLRGGGTMRAIGEHFGIHYSRVSRIVSNAERARARGKT